MPTLNKRKNLGSNPYSGAALHKKKSPLKGKKAKSPAKSNKSNSSSQMKRKYGASPKTSYS